MASQKSPNKNEHVVIAFFPSQAAADQAQAALKQWDDADDEIKLGAVGILSMEKGKIKAHVGRKTGKGAGVGAALGVIVGILSGGIGLIGGAIAGSVTGGAVGAFMKDSLHMSKEEIEALGSELEGGKVALVVTCDDYEVGPTQNQLNSLGGAVRDFVVPAAALAEAVVAGVGADIPTTMEAATDAVSDATSKAADAVSDATTKTVDAVKEAGSEVAEQASAAADAVADAASDTVDAAKDAVDDATKKG
jgi:hypothetical protein